MERGESESRMDDRVRVEGGGDDVDRRYKINPVARVMAPVAALVATMIARRILESRYRRVTDSTVPKAAELRVTFRRALVWSAATAVVTSVVETAVVRGIDRAGAHPVEGDPKSTS